MANTDNPHGFVAEQNLYGNVIPAWEGILKSNITVARGDALYADGSGCVTIATSTISTILGVSLEAISSCGTHPAIAFTPALDGIVFSGQCSADFSTTDVFTELDLTGTTGVMEINPAGSTYDVCNIIGYKDGTSMGYWAEALFVWNKTHFGSQGRNA